MGFVSDFLSKLVKKTSREEPEGVQERFASVAAPESSVDSPQEDAAPVNAASSLLDSDDGAGDWGPFSSLAENPTMQNFEEFWYQIHRIEEAGGKGDAQLHAALSAKGIRNGLHLQKIRDAFQHHFGHLHEFHQAMFSARGRQGREDLQQAASKYPSLFASIDGVDLKTFATIQARMMQSGSAGPDAVRGILSSYNLTQEKWDVINTQWLERMGGQEDPMATIALHGEYGRHLASARTG